MLSIVLCIQATGGRGDVQYLPNDMNSRKYVCSYVHVSMCNCMSVLGRVSAGVCVRAYMSGHVLLHHVLHADESSLHSLLRTAQHNLYMVN